MWPGIILAAMVATAFGLAIHNIIYLHNHHLVTKSTVTKEEFDRQTTNHVESKWLTVEVHVDGTWTILQNTTGEPDSSFTVTFQNDGTRRPEGGQNS